MLLDNRRIVLALEAVCWFATCVVLLDHTGLPRSMAVLPLMLGVLIRIEYPPPGQGVGKVGDALPGLSFELERPGATCFGADGKLLPGHAYVLIFLRKTPGSLKHMPRMSRLAAGCANVRKSVHFVAVSPGEDEVEGSKKDRGQQAAAKAVKDSALAVAVDATGAAWKNYMHQHGAMTMPHVFIVSRDGIITWHGQCNRKGLLPALKTVVRQVDLKDVAGRKAE